MLKGIALFQKHGILHHDVKPQNIVFNMKNEHIRFIDFGFMEKINAIKQKCIKNKHYIASYPFWSYPFEFPYLNKEKYMHIAERSVEDKREYFRSLVEKRMNDSSSKIAISCHVFFDFILRNHSESEKEKMIEKYFNDFMNFIVYEMKPENYDAFLDKSIRTIDLFGVGITMQLMLSYSMDYFDSMKYAALEECIFNMMRPSLMHRYTIEEAMVELMKIMDSDSLSFDSKDVPFDKKLDKKTSDKWVMDQEELLESIN
jgi:serine/threonine protein kinase